MSTKMQGTADIVAVNAVRTFARAMLVEGSLYGSTGKWGGARQLPRDTARILLFLLLGRMPTSDETNTVISAWGTDDGKEYQNV